MALRLLDYPLTSQNNRVGNQGGLESELTRATFPSRERCVWLGFPWFHCQNGVGEKAGLSATESEDAQCISSPIRVGIAPRKLRNI